MQKLLTALVISSSLLIASCGSGSADKDGSLDSKKKELADLKTQQDDLTKKIAGVEKEIAKLDPSAAKEEKPKLVGVTAVSPVAFSHAIDLQGKVDADNISYAAPRGNPGAGSAKYW